MWFILHELGEVTAFNQHDRLEAVCHAIEERLEDLAARRCAGTISDDAFIAAVLEIESLEVTPHGLTASRTRDDWTIFQLKMNGTNEICASFEFRPEAEQIRRIHGACDS